MHGYAGKFLEIDLSTEKVTEVAFKMYMKDLISVRAKSQ